VLDTLYRGGLATHFWQAWPPSWAPPVPMPADWGSTASGWRAWPHLNLWQVFLENSRRPAVLADNLAIRTCAPGGVDGNVAWGDPGSWVPR